MDRLILSALVLLVVASVVVAQAPDLDKLLEKRTYENMEGKLPYRLLQPPNYAKDGTDSYPLVVFLHGAGERGEDNKAQLKHGVAEFAKEATRKKHPCFLIAPQCPKDGWWAIGSKATAKRKGPAAGAMVLELIEALSKEFRVDQKRIYLTGLSMGGYGTWDLLSRRPELFAAGIPICGGGDPKTVEKFARLPIWAFHGDADKAVPVSRSREMIDALKKAGGEPKYTEYPKVAHDSWTQTYRDAKVLDWLFEQKRK